MDLPTEVQRTRTGVPKQLGEGEHEAARHRHGRCLMEAQGIHPMHAKIISSMLAPPSLWLLQSSRWQHRLVVDLPEMEQREPQGSSRRMRRHGGSMRDGLLGVGALGPWPQRPVGGSISGCRLEIRP